MVRYPYHSQLRYPSTLPTCGGSQSRWRGTGAHGILLGLPPRAAVHETWHADQTAINAVGHGGRARRGGCAAGDTRGPDRLSVSWVLIIVQGMVLALTPDHFYASASDFGQTALQARHSGQAQRLAVDAATCLEHLAKACLAKRSPALLTELKNESNFASLLRLLDIQAGPPPRQLRTVGLRDALARVKVSLFPVCMSATCRRWSTSATASCTRRRTTRLRIGCLWRSYSTLTRCFRTDALLQDLGRDRAEFWAPQLAVVDALLMEAADKVERRVRVSIAAAKANFEQRWRRIDLRNTNDPPAPHALITEDDQVAATGLHPASGDVDVASMLTGSGAPIGILCAQSIAEWSSWRVVNNRQGDCG